MKIEMVPVSSHTVGVGLYCSVLNTVKSGSYLLNIMQFPITLKLMSCIFRYT